MPLNLRNECSGCGRKFYDREKATAVIPFVEMDINDLDDNEARLKLSTHAIESRTLKVYCRDCLNLYDFIAYGG